MAMLTELPEKLAIEVEEDNVMLVEDVEGSKKIKISELMKVFRPVQERFVKEIVNEAIDRMAESLLDAKFEFSNYTTLQYKMDTWIDNNSGDIQIALFDVQKDKWLTREEIEELFKNDYIIKVYIGRTWEYPVSFKVLSFCEEYEEADIIDQDKDEDDAGYIVIHFDGLTNNQISQIIYEDIEIIVVGDEKKEIRYEFLRSRDRFANAVPWKVPYVGCCPCMGRYHPIQDPEQPPEKEPETEEPEQPTEPETPPEEPETPPGTEGDESGGSEEEGEDEP